MERAKSVVDAMSSRWESLEKLLDAGGQGGRLKARSAADHLGGLESGWDGLLRVAEKLKEKVKQVEEEGSRLRREAAAEEEKRNEEFREGEKHLEADFAQRKQALKKEYEDRMTSLVTEYRAKEQANQREWERKVSLLEEKDKRFDEQIKLLGDVRASLGEGKEREITALNSSKTLAEQRATTAEKEMVEQKKKVEQLEANMKEVTSASNQHKNDVAGKEAQISGLRRDVAHEQERAGKAEGELTSARRQIHDLGAAVEKWRGMAVVGVEGFKKREELLQEARDVEATLREELKSEMQNAANAGALVTARSAVLEGMEQQKAKLKKRAVEVEARNRQLEIEVGVLEGELAAEKDKSKQVEKGTKVAAINVLRELHEVDRDVQEHKTVELGIVQAEAQRLGELRDDFAKIALYMRKSLRALEKDGQGDKRDDREDGRRGQDGYEDRGTNPRGGHGNDDGDDDDDDDDDNEGKDDVRIIVPIDDAGGDWEMLAGNDEVANAEVPVENGDRVAEAGVEEGHYVAQGEQAATAAAEATDEMQDVVAEDETNEEAEALQADPWEGKLAVIKEVFDQVECPEGFDKVALANELVDLMPNYTAEQWRTEIRKASDFRLGRSNCLVGKVSGAKTGYALRAGARRNDCRVHKNKTGFCGRLQMKQDGGYRLEETQRE